MTSPRSAMSSGFPQLEYTIEDVRRAGEALRQRVAGDDEGDIAKAAEIFRVAHSWRDSHFYPMRRIRAELGGQVRRAQKSGLTVARLKMMQSIRRKLQSSSLHLDTIQDLGGCRAILRQIDDTKTLVAACRENLPHKLYRETDYITRPRASGYRSHHLIYEFKPADESEEEFAGRRIEVQIRSRLQHSWATAVEAVGTFRKEDMKGGKGSKEWLRLFELMGSELAVAEGCPEVKGAPSRRERIAEIKVLDTDLMAANTLENLSQAFKYLETFHVDGNPKYFVIKYDNVKATVRVETFDLAIAGTKSLDEAEIRTRHINSVLVEAESIKALRAAYPNYFGDVQIFKRNLRHIVQGRDAQEYTMAPQEAAPRPPKEAPDTAWFRRSRFRKPKGA